MSKVSKQSLHDWKDGETVTANEYKRERELLRVANNDNDEQRLIHIAKMVDPTSDDETKDKHVSNKDLKELHDKIATTNENLDKKTDKTGDHKGTWRGLTPEFVGDALLSQRIKKLEDNRPIVENNIRELEKLHQPLNNFKSGLDNTGIFTVFEQKRTDGTLFLKSVLSDPDSNFNYTVQTITYYEDDGETVKEVEIYDIGYDELGNQTSEVKR